MPIYEYACKACDHHFEELVSRYGTLVACPQCTSGEVSQLLSTFSARAVGGDQPAPRAPAPRAGGCCGGGCGCRH
jgi:putative FmdB family regulatory protein